MMASRKKPQETMSLFGATKVSPPVQVFPPEIAEAPGDGSSGGVLTPEGQGRAPRLRVVPPLAEDEVSVEPTSDGRFWVSLVRHNGTTRAAVLYARKQLQMLLRRIPAALEVGDGDSKT